MSGPGKGRYTTYVPISSKRNSLLWKLFNGRAPNDAGVFYGEETYKNDKAAEAVLARATAKVVNGVGGILPSDGKQAGDLGMFVDRDGAAGSVDLSYSGAPNTNDVKWDSAKSNFSGSPTTNSGGPANAFVPDVSSPGPGKTLGIDKDVNPNISIADLKPAYVPGAPDTGTVSPNATSSIIGSSPLGKDLKPGKSSI
jgi:hypothetical protein